MADAVGHPGAALVGLRPIHHKGPHDASGEFLAKARANEVTTSNYPDVVDEATRPVTSPSL